MICFVNSDCLRRILQSLEFSVIRTNLQLEAAILLEPSNLLLRLNDKKRLPSTLGGISVLLPPPLYTITLSLYSDKTRPQEAESFGESLQSLMSEFPGLYLYSVEQK